MTTVKSLGARAAMLGCCLAFAATLNAATVWTGPMVEFSKDGFADPTLAENQDALTLAVSLTRGSIQGLYNIAQEPFYEGSGGSPIDTEWAFQGLNGNPDSGVTAQNFAALNFGDWRVALGSQAGNNILDRPGVLHLISDDIYLDILFTEWGVGSTSGGSVSYLRASPVPVPAAAWMLASALGVLGFLRRRRVA